MQDNATGVPKLITQTAPVLAAALEPLDPAVYEELSSKLKRTLKKNKPLAKVLKKLSPSTLMLVLDQPDKQTLLLDTVKKIDPKYICNLTKAIIKQANRVFGSYYEATAIKEYVVKYNKTPDDIPINIQTLSQDDSSLRAVLQPDLAFDKEKLKYVKTKLENLTVILKSQAQVLKDRQAEFTEVLVQLLDFQRPSFYSDQLQSLLPVLENYPQLASSLLRNLSEVWGPSALDELTHLQRMLEPSSFKSINSALSACLANEMIKNNQIQEAREIYDILYNQGSVEPEDLYRLASILLEHFWTDDIPSQYNSKEFQTELFKAGKALNKTEAIFSVCLSLSRESTDLYTKVNYLQEILQIDPHNDAAQGDILALAERLATNKSCKEFLPVLTRVLIHHNKYQLLADLYGELQPCALLDDPRNLNLLIMVAQELEQKDIQHAVEVHNLCAKLNLETKEYSSSSAIVQHILDDLDPANAEALLRLSELAKLTGKLSLLAKYSISNVIDRLVGQGQGDQKAYAVQVITELLENIEAKIDSKAVDSQSSESIQPQISALEDEILRTKSVLNERLTVISSQLDQSRADTERSLQGLKTSVSDSTQTKQVATLKLLVTDLTNRVSEVETVKRANTDLTSQLSRSEARLKAVEDKNAKQEAEVTKLRSEIESLKKSLAERPQGEQVSIKALTELKEANASLQKQIDDFVVFMRFARN
jgi:hypothetical protein